MISSTITKTTHGFPSMITTTTATATAAATHGFPSMITTTTATATHGFPLV